MVEEGLVLLSKFAFMMAICANCLWTFATNFYFVYRGVLQIASIFFWGRVCRGTYLTQCVLSMQKKKVEKLVSILRI